MTHAEIKDSIAAYCLGALDDQELATIEQHLQEGCTDCQAEMADMLQVAGSLAFSVEPELPPAALKERIISTVEPQKRPAPPVTSERPDYKAIAIELLEKTNARWRRLSLGLAFAVAIVVVGFGLYTFSLRDDITLLNGRIAFNEEIVKDLQTQLTEKEEVIQAVQSPKIRIADLKGQKPAPESSGKVFWDPETRKALFVAFDLPALPSDKDYQLWMLRGSLPVDAGVFSVDENGVARILLDTISDTENLAAFAVTLEPKGGVPSPTGDMYLLGTTGP